MKFIIPFVRLMEFETKGSPLQKRSFMPRRMRRHRIETRIRNSGLQIEITKKKTTQDRQKLVTAKKNA